MTSATLKPIPTSWGGVRFRSRLEARWAVFFDFLHIPWEYEPQGFDIGDGQAYLPDFILGMGQLIWAEVKPSVSADPDGVARWRKFLSLQPLGTDGYLLTSMTGSPDQEFINGSSSGDGWSHEVESPWSCCPDRYHFRLCARGALGGCQECGETIPCSSCEGSGMHKGGPVRCYCCDPYGSGRVPASTKPWDFDKRIGAAYDLARSCRFGTGAPA